jgi:hypothetical protein
MEYLKGGKTRKNKTKSRKNKTRGGASRSRSRSRSPKSNSYGYTNKGHGSMITHTEEQKNEIRHRMKQDHIDREQFKANQKYKNKVRSLSARLDNKYKSLDYAKYSQLKKYLIRMKGEEDFLNEKELAFIKKYEKDYPHEIIN